MVDEQMRTSDPAIYAVGDVIEVHDVVVGQEIILPLAGPANRQGRVAAEAIAGRTTRFRGVQGTVVVGVLGLTAGMTGASEKGLRRAGLSDFGVVYLHPGHHAGYYPGARPIHLKLLFSRSDGRILGAQAVGEEGVDKRLDVLATMIQMRRHRARPGGGRALLRAAVRRGEGPRQRRGDDGRSNALPATCRSPTGGARVHDRRTCSTCASPTSSPGGTSRGPRTSP